MKNKGFSLVELVIVIAIMGILIGVMAPLLIMYVNKTKVSSDIQLCDSVQEALMINMVECSSYDFLDLNSKGQIAALQSGSVVHLFDLDDDTTFAEEVADTLGICCFCDSFTNKFQSSATSGGELLAQMYDGELVVWIDKSNAAGKNTVIQCNSAADINELVIASK